MRGPNKQDEGYPDDRLSGAKTTRRIAKERSLLRFSIVFGYRAGG